MLVDHKLSPLHSLIQQRKTMEKVKRIPARASNSLSTLVDGFITTDSVRFQMSQNISWAIPKCDDFDMSWIITACSAWWTMIHQRWERPGTRCYFTLIQIRLIQIRMNGAIDNLFIFWHYSLTRSDKHSPKDDYSFQLDIGHCDRINVRSTCVLTIFNRIDH